MKRIIMLLLACCLLVGAAAAAGGAGTAANPYVIETPAELQSIANNLAAYYVLANDIDLQGYSFSPIGSISSPFSGQLDGNGKTITNLNLDLSSSFYVGLFAALTSGATIKDLNLENCVVHGEGRTGCLVGQIVMSENNHNLATLSNINLNQCSVYVDGSDNGILCGLIYTESVVLLSNCNLNQCSILCNNNIDLTTCNAIGGLIGDIYDANNVDIINCDVVNSLINNAHQYGGLITSAISNSDVSISNCNIDSSMVISLFHGFGGLCGTALSNAVINVNNCIVKNSIIKGLGSVGGVVGKCDSPTILTISDCFVLDSTIYASEGPTSGIISDCTLVSTNINNCVVSGCSILSPSVSTSAGVCSYLSGDGASTAPIVGCTVENTNIFGSIVYDIGPAGSYDSTSTASGINNVPNRYLYASGLTATPNGATVSYTLEGQQGSTTVEATQGTAQSWAWTFGDGATSSVAEDTTHTYAAPGTYSTSLTLKNYLDSTGVTVTTSGYNILPIPPTVSASANVLQLGQSTTLSAVGTLFSTIQWQYSTDSGATWQDISGATANNYVWTPEAGSYQVRAHVTAVGTGYTANSEVLSLTVYPPPTITNPNANPQQGPLSQSVVLSADVSDVNGDTTYQWQEFASGSWIDISGATTNPATVLVSDGTGTLHQYRLAASGIGGTSYSSTVTYQSVAPPQFTAFEVSPLSGGIPLEVSFSATASDTSGYRWEYSSDGTIWVQIATGSAGSYTFANEGVYYIRVIATGTGGTTTSAVATITASNLLPEFTQISATPSAGVAPFSVTLSAAATNGATFVWERQSGSSWVQIGTGASLTYTIPSGTSVGMVYFRAIAANQYGSVISASIAVEVGAAPAAEITTPTAGAVFGSGKLISFAAADAGAGVTYSWDFGDGVSGSGRTTSHSYAEEGFYMVTLRTSSQFGSSEDIVRIEIVEATGDIWLAVTDVSSSDVTLQATIEVSPVSSGTLVWFELESMSGTVVYKSPQLTYSGPVSYTASGLPLMAGETYRAVAYSNYYGYSIPVLVTLVDAVQPPYEQLGNAWNDGLNREPFNVSALVAAGVGVYGGALGGGAVGAAVAFGVIVMFVIVGLWLRQQDIVIPLTLTLIVSWFVIGNLPGDWRPIAYTLMVVCVVAIFFYLFRKRIE